MAFGFGPLPSAPAGITMEDIARLFGKAPMGAGQGFSGSSTAPAPDTSMLQPAPAAAPQSVAVPLPPPRPLSFGPLPRSGADATPEADIPATGAQPIMAPPQATPSAASQTEGPSLLDRFGSGLSRNSDLLIGLGTGLMSNRGIGAGLSAGFQNAQRASALASANDLQRAELAMKQLKLSRETRGENATAAWLKGKGFDDALATSAMSNPAVLSSVLAQINKDPSIVEIGGKKYSLKPGEKPSEANLLGDAGGDNIQLVNRPDGSIVAVNKSAIGQEGGATPATAATTVAPGINKTAAEQQERREALVAQGLDPNDSRYRDYVVSGSLPKENQQLLTASDKQAIREGEDSILTHQNALGQLKKALSLSPKAYEGVGSGARAMFMTNFPEALGGGGEAAMATREFDNMMSTQMLDSLKSIFGGNPTEGERAALKDIQGISSMPHELREKIIANTIAKVESRLNLEQRRVDDLRGGSYYKAKPAVGAEPQPPVTVPTDTAPAAAVAPPKIAAKADYDALPSGRQYIAPDGSLRTKP